MNTDMPIAPYLRAARAHDELTDRIGEIATFVGMQETLDGDFFELYVLRQAIPGHPCQSSVSRATLETFIRTENQPPTFPPMQNFKMRFWNSAAHWSEAIASLFYALAYLCRDRSAKANLAAINARKPLD